MEHYNSQIYRSKLKHYTHACSFSTFTFYDIVNRDYEKRSQNKKNFAGSVCVCVCLEKTFVVWMWDSSLWPPPEWVLCFMYVHTYIPCVASLSHLARSRPLPNWPFGYDLGLLSLHPPCLHLGLETLHRRPRLVLRGMHQHHHSAYEPDTLSCWTRSREETCLCSIEGSDRISTLVNGCLRIWLGSRSKS